MTSADRDLPSVERLLAEGDWIRSLARRLVADPATADDIAQDATVIALTRPPRDPGVLRAWLRRVVRNLSVSAHRSAARREALAVAAAPREPGEETAAVVARWEIRRQVVEAVLALDEPYRSTLLLRFFEGLAPADVAARESVPLDTVKTRQRRALEMLRARLAHLDDDRRRGLGALLLLVELPAPAKRLRPVPAAVAGGVVMSTLAKVTAAVVVAALLGAGWWTFGVGSGGGGGADGPALDESRESADAHGGRARRQGTAQPALAVTPNASDAVDPERYLRGVVVDRGGRPVAGARVTVNAVDLHRWYLAASRDDTPPVGAVIADSRTGADGAFSVRLAAGAHALLQVTADGFADVALRPSEAGQELRIVLDPPTRLRVRVVFPNGAACEGARVVATSWSVAQGWMRAATTASDGVVTWDGLPRGRAASAHLEVFVGSGRAPTAAECALEDRDVNETTVALGDDRIVEGLVVDAETGDPVPGTRISSDGRKRPVAVADVAGHFRLLGWPEPRWTGDPGARVVAMADGYAPAWAAIPGAKDARPMKIELRRGFDVRGVVTDASGRPVEGALVVAAAKQWNDSNEVMLDTATDAAGAFRVGGLLRGADAPAAILAPGFARADLRWASPPKTEALVDAGTIVLVPGRTLRGRVVDAAGLGLAAMHVRLLSAHEGDDDAFGESRTTHDGGRFIFPTVGPGRHMVHVSGRGPDRTETIAEVVVPADADPPLLTIVAGTPPPPPKTQVLLRTRVVDEDGHAVPGVRFVVFGNSGSDDRGVSTSDGAVDVACSDMPQGVTPYLEGDLGARYLHTMVWLRPGATSADIVLRRAEPISGTVVDAAGRPVQAWVEALVGATQAGAGMSDAEGRFGIGVPAGATVTLEARPSSRFQPPPPDVAVQRGVLAGSRDVTLRVQPVALDRALDLVLVLPDGASPGDSEVVADFHGADHAKPVLAKFEASGRARLEGLPRAPVGIRVMVRLTGEGAYVYTGLRPIRIDGETTSLRVIEPGFRVVRGRVVDAAGAASPGASVFSSGSNTLADAQGWFSLRLPHDATPPFPVSASKMPYDRKNPERGWDLVEDASGRELEIVLRPAPPSTLR